MGRNVFLLLIVLFASLSFASALTESVALDDYVIDFEYDEDDVEVGKTFRLQVTITNEADETRNNIVFSLDLDDPFDDIGDDSKDIGTLEADESKTVSFRLEVEDDALDQDYEIEFEIEDNVDSETDEIAVSVESNVPEIVIGNVQSLPTTITPDTDDIKLTLTLENIGEGDAESVRLKLNLPEGISPSGSFSDLASVGVITSGNNKEVDFFIDTDEILEATRYEGLLEVTFEDDDGDTFVNNLRFDIPVKGSPQFLIVDSNTNPKRIAQGESGELRVEIQNIGEEEGSETSIRIFENADFPFNFNEKTNFIGDIDPSQSGTGIINFEVDSDAVAKDYIVRMQIRTVSDGLVLVEEQSVVISVSEREKRNIFPFLIGLMLFLLVVIVVMIVAFR